jgi:hypothetical protein
MPFVLTLWGVQEKGKGDGKSFLGVGAMLKDESQYGHTLFVETVEAAIKHWTRIWIDAADYQDAITTNVQVGQSCLPPSLANFVMSSRRRVLNI